MKNIYILFKFIFLTLFCPRSDTSQIKKIHTITYRDFSPNGGKGGGSAVQTCQQLLLGKEYKSLELKYTYFSRNKYFDDWKTRIADLWGGVYFAINNTKNERHAVYITHDYGTGFGLALLKKKFIYISHLQGPKVEEKINFNEHLTSVDKKIIGFCERYVFKKAFYICFPSLGAKNYYFESNYKSVDESEVKIGPVLYNTLYIDPEPVKIENIEKSSDYLTFLSVGALTTAKGIDQIPSFLYEYLQLHKGKVRWFIVGNGPLKESIESDIENLKKEFKNLDVTVFNQCQYAEIRYLSKISDVYIMFHRISIFDLATLEAMNDGKCLVLSKKGGNIDFNRQENIIFHDGDYCETAKSLFNANISDLKDLNKKTYDIYFSKEVFVESYKKIINDLTK